ILCFYFVYNAFNYSFFIDYKSFTVNSVKFPPHKLFWSPNAERIDYCLVFVSQQWKRQVVFFFKFILTLFRISAHAKQFKSLLLKFTIIIAKVASLSCASGSISLWIEKDNPFFSFVIC